MSSDEYRQHAAECLGIAETLFNGQHRGALLIMAQAWLHLAHQAEKNSETILVYEFPELRQQIAQQQQQIQSKADNSKDE